LSSYKHLFSLSHLVKLKFIFSFLVNLSYLFSGSKSLNRLHVLNLDGNTIDGNKLRESLRALSTSIRKLSMSYNNFNGTILAQGSNIYYVHKVNSDNDIFINFF